MYNHMQQTQYKGRSGSKPFPLDGERLDRGESRSPMRPFSSSVGERKIMNHFVVKYLFRFQLHRSRAGTSWLVLSLSVLLPRRRNFRLFHHQSAAVTFCPPSRHRKVWRPISFRSISYWTVYNGCTRKKWQAQGFRSTYNPGSRISSPLRS